MKTSEYIYADFGNSKAKLLLPDGSYKILEYNSHFKDYINSLTNLDLTLVFSSVNQLLTDNLVLNIQKDKLINATQLLKKQTLMDFSNISGMGSDRLLGLMGSIALAKPPNITIDFGTATTINCIDINNVVLGGVIFPGISLQEKSLRTDTSGLKKWSLNSNAPLLGTNTSDAISYGILHGSAIAVSQTIRSLAKTYFFRQRPIIFLTGGHLSLILPLLDLPSPMFHEPFLVLDGLKYLTDNTL